MAGRTLAIVAGLALVTFPASVEAWTGLGGSARTSANAPAPRFPRWPTEVHRIAAPLYSGGTDEVAGDRVRADALLALDAFATPVIEDALLRSLEDPAVQVRREALRLCFERALRSCIDGAATLYRDGVEPSLRIGALKVLALDSAPRSASILIAALRDRSDAIRAQAAELLGAAPLAETMQAKARAALLAKLPDGSAVVRRAAARGLGRMGPGNGALAIARVLDDPEPTVRAAAAEALARIRDPRVLPALRRAVHAPSEPVVAKALVRALAVLETPQRETDLLAFIDDPPAGLNARQVADAIARRLQPGTPLILGLVDRLRDPGLAQPCLHALLMFGDRAREGIEAVLARGAEAPIELELHRLLAALDLRPDDSAASTPRLGKPRGAQRRWPPSDDVAAWRATLRDPRSHARVDAALQLGARAPTWLGGALGAFVADAVSPRPVRVWLVALARSETTPSLGRAHAIAIARLTQWASAETEALPDRCLSILALGTLAHSETRHQNARAAVTHALADRRAEIRMCAAATAPKAGLPPEALEAALVDPDPRVRAVAALAIATFGTDALSASARTRLALLHARDPSGEVRRAAARARDRARLGATNPGPGLVYSPAPGLAGRRPVVWLAHGLSPSEPEPAANPASSIWLPTVGAGQDRWLLVPGEPDAGAMSPKYSLPIDIGQ